MTNADREFEKAVDRDIAALAARQTDEERACEAEEKHILDTLRFATQDHWATWMDNLEFAGRLCAADIIEEVQTRSAGCDYELTIDDIIELLRADNPLEFFKTNILPDLVQARYEAGLI